MADIQWLGKQSSSAKVTLDLGQNEALLDAQLFYIDKDTFKSIPITRSVMHAGHAEWEITAAQLEQWGWGFDSFYYLITPAVQDDPTQIDVISTVSQGGKILPARKKGVPINGAPPNFTRVKMDPIPAHTISRRGFDVFFAV